jgi:hypothetical protein
MQGCQSSYKVIALMNFATSRRPHKDVYTGSIKKTFGNFFAGGLCGRNTNPKAS